MRHDVGYMKYTKCPEQVAPCLPGAWGAWTHPEVVASQAHTYRQPGMARPAFRVPADMPMRLGTNALGGRCYVAGAGWDTWRRVQTRVQHWHVRDSVRMVHILI